MASSILSAPAISSEVEWVFSSSGQTVTPRWNHLSIESIESVEYLRSWKQKDLVQCENIGKVHEILAALDSAENQVWRNLGYVSYRIFIANILLYTAISS